MKELPPWVSSVAADATRQPRPDAAYDSVEPVRVPIPAAAAELFQAISRAGPRLRDGLWLPGRMINYVMEIGRRRRFMREYSWAVPAPAAVGAIAAFVGGRRVIEAGAGAGLWARLLSDFGVSITATDDGSWSAGTVGDEQSLPGGFSVALGRFFPVEQLDGAEAVRRYADHEALLLCWPPPDRPMAYACLSAFRGDSLVYIGDRRCTGDDAFRLALATDWRLVESVELPSWPGIDDTVYMYRRRVWDTRGEMRQNPHLSLLQ
jgi:hypothetical protein